MPSLSFDAIVPGSSVTVYDNGMVDAVELTMVLTGKDSRHSCEVLRRLNRSIFDGRKLRPLKLPGKGNLSTQILNFNDAVELVMVLPGKVAMRTRPQFAEIITRYFAGDASLAGEIQANAESSNPIPQLARVSLLGQKRGSPDDADGGAPVKRQAVSQAVGPTVNQPVHKPLSAETVAQIQRAAARVITGQKQVSGMIKSLPGAFSQCVKPIENQIVGLGQEVSQSNRISLEQLRSLQGKLAEAEARSERQRYTIACLNQDKTKLTADKESLLRLVAKVGEEKSKSDNERRQMQEECLSVKEKLKITKREVERLTRENDRERALVDRLVRPGSFGDE